MQSKGLNYSFNSQLYLTDFAYKPMSLGLSIWHTIPSFYDIDVDLSLVLVKPRIDMNNVSCRRVMTEILLKAA